MGVTSSLLYNQLNSESVAAATELEVIVPVQADLTELIEQTNRTARSPAQTLHLTRLLMCFPCKLLMMG